MRNLFEWAVSALDPSHFKEECKCDGARVSTHVISQIRDLPCEQGISVTASGLLPSSLLIPHGSRILGRLQEVKERLMMELIADCQENLTLLQTQLN